MNVPIDNSSLSKESIFQQISRELNLSVASIRATVKMLDESATIPFMARYRKEVTGGLDEVQLADIRDTYKRINDLIERKEAVLKSLDSLGVLTDSLRKELAQAETITRVEDLYAPHKPKRRTRAQIAKEKGLENLAEDILSNQGQSFTQFYQNRKSEFKEPVEETEAIAGVKDIIAEKMSDHPDTRDQIRNLFLKESILKSEVFPGKEEEAAKYKDYFSWEEPITKVTSHRMLAIRRGSQEGFLMFSIRPDENRALAIIKKGWLTAQGENSTLVEQAIEDGYKRLLAPSMETEARLFAKKKADAEAIEVFAQNVKTLLLASPLGQKRILAIDPGFRTGCKVVVLNEQGDLQADTVIYPEQGDRRTESAAQIILTLVAKFQVQVIAIGNGTASRETESFVRKLSIPSEIPILVVNESGASIYSASEVARKEFPDKDITVRGTVSIGRRLMDPLAELVKIDPKSLGVGQYQHDVDQRGLKAKLDDVVESCVNSVGVELNTASSSLLKYVSGLNERLADSIVAFRHQNGPFVSRKQLLKVPGLGAKTFEQAAGFLRIRNAENPLDQSAVHPEVYPIVEKMASDIGSSVTELINQPQLRQQINLANYITDEFGLPTLKDILSELEKPGRDPREAFVITQFDESVQKPEDLVIGQKLPGIVTNVAAFGAFVDIGVHQDGLVHISQLADRFIKDPNEIVHPGKPVEVTVIELDLKRNRISLSMKSNPDFGNNSNKPKQVQKRSPKSQTTNNPFASLDSLFK